MKRALHTTASSWAAARGRFWERLAASLPASPSAAARVTASPSAPVPPPYAEYAEALLPFANPKSGESTVLRKDCDRGGADAPGQLRVGGVAVAVEAPGEAVARPWLTDPWDTPAEAAEAAALAAQLQPQRGGEGEAPAASARPRRAPAPVPPGAEAGVFLAHSVTAREAVPAGATPYRVVGPGNARGGRGEGGEGVKAGVSTTGRPGGSTLTRKRE